MNTVTRNCLKGLMKLRHYGQPVLLVLAGALLTLLFQQTSPGRYQEDRGALQTSDAGDGTMQVLHASSDKGSGCISSVEKDSDSQENEDQASGGVVGGGDPASSQALTFMEKSTESNNSTCSLSVSSLVRTMARRGIGWLSHDDRLLMQQLLQLEWVDDSAYFRRYKRYFSGRASPWVAAGGSSRNHRRRWGGYVAPITSRFRMPRVLLQPRKACSTRARQAPNLLVLVPSVPGHRASRDAIRHTWGSPAYPHFRSWPTAGAVIKKMKVIFVLGTSRRNDISALQRENARYQDLLRLDFHDSYLNLTIKIMSALSWASKSCRRASYVAKIDEDTMVNVPKLQRMLHKISSVTNRFILGHAMKGSRVFRGGKWAVSSEIYPQKTYPYYVVGHSYVMPSGVARELLRAGRRYHQPLLPIEDAFVTGILSGLAGVKKLHMDAMAGTSSRVGGCVLFHNAYVTQTHFSAKGLRSLWREVSRRCSKKR